MADAARYAAQSDPDRNFHFRRGWIERHLPAPEHKISRVVDHAEKQWDRLVGADRETGLHQRRDRA